MKNFKEWYAKGKIGFWKDNDIQIAQREAWRAALEWVNDNTVCNDRGREEFPEEFEDTFVEELGEEDGN